MIFNSEKFLLGVKHDEEYYNQMLNIIKKRNLWDCLIQIFLAKRDSHSLEMVLICLLSKQIMLKHEVKKVLTQEVLYGEIAFGKQFTVKFKNSEESKSQENEENSGEEFKFSLIDPWNDTYRIDQSHDNILFDYLGIYCLIHELFTFDTLQNSVYDIQQKIEFENEKEEYEYHHFQEQSLVYLLEWIFSDSNALLLGKGNIQILLEIFYDLYLNFNFLNSEKVLKSLLSIWKTINKYRPKKTQILPVTKADKMKSKDGQSIEQELGTWIMFRTDDLDTKDKNIPILLYLIMDHYMGASFPVQISFFLIKVMNLSTINSIFRESKFVQTLVIKKTKTLLSENFKEQVF